MLTVLLPLAVFFCVLLLLTDRRTAGSVMEAVLNASLIIFAVFAATTELLSAFNRIDRAAFVAAWSLVAAALGSGLLFRRPSLPAVVGLLRSRASGFITSIRATHFRAADTIAGVLTLILLLGVFVGSLTLTNNYDSYTYHL